MKIHEQLLSKNGMATIILAKSLLTKSIGQKIPTITELSESFGLVRGTVQNALKNLTSSGAITIEARGHLGSFLVQKDNTLLLKYAGIDSLVGSMPLPYSKRYEGLASGLIVSMENGFNIPVSMAYMRGAMNRIAMLIQNRYDFAIVSRFAVENFSKKNPDLIETVINFGPTSYLSCHALMLADPEAKEVKDGMCIGIDSSSVDQLVMTKKVCEGKQVEFVEVEYSNILTMIESGQIDASVMNIDEVVEKKRQINYIEINDDENGDTEAVLVINKENAEIGAILQQVIDIETVLNIQKMVMEGQMTPSY